MRLANDGAGDSDRFSESFCGPVGQQPNVLPRAGRKRTAPRRTELPARCYTLSTLSGCTLEDVREAMRRTRVVVQVYLCGGRGRGRPEAVERAPAGIAYSALVLTIDTPVAGLARTARAKRGQGAARRQVSEFLLVWQFASKPLSLASTCLRDARTDGVPERACFPELLDRCRTADVGAALEHVDRDLGRSPLDPAASRRGRSLVKGVHIAADARRAVGEGADAIVVSNHGGRRLDRVRFDDREPAGDRLRGRHAHLKFCSTAASGAAAISSRR